MKKFKKKAAVVAEPEVKKAPVKKKVEPVVEETEEVEETEDEEGVAEESVVAAIDEISDVLKIAKGDAVKFDEGNVAAGRRVRTYMASVSERVKDARKLITEITNARKEG